jgi:nucleoside-diphosphate-sugar epimerase
MAQTSDRRTCLVSGTTGYLGSRLRTALQQRGWRVVELTRSPARDSDAVSFHLGEDVPSLSLTGAEALVHCAYDLTQRSWPTIHRVNVIGSEKLFHAAREAKIGRVIYVSSTSAFSGNRSFYGRAKLATESIASSLGASAIRPGLIWGWPPGGMFKRLVEQVQRRRLLPLFEGGSQIQYLVHEQDLTDFICRGVDGQVAVAKTPVTIANEQGWTLRQILEEIARANDKRISFFTIPWRLAWAALRMAELVGMRSGGLRSDSLISLVHQNPDPSFALQRQLQVVCRPFYIDTQIDARA